MALEMLIPAKRKSSDMQLIVFITVIGCCVTVCIAGAGCENDKCPYLTNSFGGNLFSDSMIAQVLTKMINKIFKGNMKASPYQSLNPTPKTIACPRDLNCDFKANKGKCRWRNVKNDGGKGSTNVFLGSGKAYDNSTSWPIIMGAEDKPDPGYGLVASQKTNTSIWFVSDPIPAHGGSGYLRLKHWISPFSTLQACTRYWDRHTNPANRKKPYTFIKCTNKLRYDIISGPSKLKVHPIEDGPFEIVLKFGPWPMKQGGLILFDDIKYTSDELCPSDPEADDDRSNTASQGDDDNEGND